MSRTIIVNLFALFNGGVEKQTLHSTCPLFAFIHPNLSLFHMYIAPLHSQKTKKFQNESGDRETDTKRQQRMVERYLSMITLLLCFKDFSMSFLHSSAVPRSS